MIWSVSSVDRAFDKRSRGNGLTPIRADPCNYPSVSTSIEIDQHASFHSFPQHYLEAILDPARSPLPSGFCPILARDEEHQAARHRACPQAVCAILVGCGRIDRKACSTQLFKLERRRDCAGSHPMPRGRKTASLASILLEGSDKLAHDAFVHSVKVFTSLVLLYIHHKSQQWCSH